MTQTQLRVTAARKELRAALKERNKVIKAPVVNSTAYEFVRKYIRIEKSSYLIPYIYILGESTKAYYNADGYYKLTVKLPNLTQFGVPYTENNFIAVDIPNSINTVKGLLPYLTCLRRNMYNTIVKQAIEAAQDMSVAQANNTNF